MNDECDLALGAALYPMFSVETTLVDEVLISFQGFCIVLCEISTMCETGANVQIVSDCIAPGCGDC